MLWKVTFKRRVIICLRFPFEIGDLISNNVSPWGPSEIEPCWISAPPQRSAIAPAIGRSRRHRLGHGSCRSCRAVYTTYDQAVVPSFREKAAGLAWTCFTTATRLCWTSLENSARSLFGFFYAFTPLLLTHSLDTFALSKLWNKQHLLDCIELTYSVLIRSLLDFYLAFIIQYLFGFSYPCFIWLLFFLFLFFSGALFAMLVVVPCA